MVLKLVRREGIFSCNTASGNTDSPPALTVLCLQQCQVMVKQNCVRLGYVQVVFAFFTVFSSYELSVL